MDLRGEDDVVAPPARQGFRNDLLGLARRVDVGGVDEVDPAVEGAVHDPDALVVVGVAPRAEHHRPETERADPHAGSTEDAVLHVPIVPSLGRWPPQGRSSAGSAASALWEALGLMSAGPTG